MPTDWRQIFVGVEILLIWYRLHGLKTVAWHKWETSQCSMLCASVCNPVFICHSWCLCVECCLWWLSLLWGKVSRFCPSWSLRLAPSIFSAFVFLCIVSGRLERVIQSHRVLNEKLRSLRRLFMGGWRRVRNCWDIRNPGSWLLMHCGGVGGTMIERRSERASFWV